MAIRGDKTDYLRVEADCLKAIEEFKVSESVTTWLKKYKSLYNKISIAPEGLPLIIDSHLNGDSFEGISEFGELYQTVNKPYE
jgi:hypothetical protein